MTLIGVHLSFKPSLFTTQIQYSHINDIYISTKACYKSWLCKIKDFAKKTVYCFTAALLGKAASPGKERCKYGVLHAIFKQQTFCTVIPTIQTYTFELNFSLGWKHKQFKQLFKVLDYWFPTIRGNPCLLADCQLSSLCASSQSYCILSS